MHHALLPLQFLLLFDEAALVSRYLSTGSLSRVDGTGVQCVLKPATIIWWISWIPTGGSFYSLTHTALLYWFMYEFITTITCIFHVIVVDSTEARPRLRSERGTSVFTRHVRSLYYSRGSPPRQCSMRSGAFVARALSPLPAA